MRKYKGVDVCRVIFACLIPVLHINFSGAGIEIVRQYFARLGVPFFFAVTGMFLARSMQIKVRRDVLKRYAIRIGRLLLIWLAVYMPILLLRKEGVTLQEILCKTPAYLWYLTAVLAASAPFCLVRNRRLLFCASLVLYLLGTAFGGSYRWLTGGCPAYESVFLTTRNGVFFALPMMCVGEMTWKRERPSWALLLLFGALLAAEITLVGRHAAPTDDRSLYFALPFFLYEFMLLARQWNPNVDTTLFSGISSAIYLMQFGIITLVMKVGQIAGVPSPWTEWLAWAGVVFLAPLFYYLIRNRRIAKMLF